MTESAKPSLAYLAVSILVILASLFLVAAAIAAFAATWDPFSLIGAAILLPLPSALAIQQYRAAFRHVRSAAKFASVLLVVVAGFSAFILTTSVAQIVTGDGKDLWLGWLLPWLSVSVVSSLAGLLNLRWGRCLSGVVEKASRFRFSMRELGAAIAAISLVAALASSLIRSTPKKYAEHVGIVDAPFGLPSNATDISFCHGFRGTIAYEFTIDEDSFRGWVASGIGSIESRSAGVQLVAITNPVTIPRYNLLSVDLNGPESIIVATGVDYWWSFEDRRVHAVFDSTTNRAYYFARFH